MEEKEIISERNIDDWTPSDGQLSYRQLSTIASQMQDNLQKMQNKVKEATDYQFYKKIDYDFAILNMKETLEQYPRGKEIINKALEELEDLLGFSEKKE